MSFILNMLWPRGSQTTTYVPGRDDPRSAPPLASPCLGAYRLRREPQHRHRTLLRHNDINIWGWPSRGGVIVLEDPTPPDFDFLNLDPLDPPLERDPNQDSEDEFCRQLLRLGATWWDSKERRDFVYCLAQANEDAWTAVDSDQQLQPTRPESRWVRVGWLAESPGSFYVLEKTMTGIGVDRQNDFVPRDAGRIALARTMDERCAVLQRLGATLYTDISQYSGAAFIRAWEDGKDEGEVGPLVKTHWDD